MDIGHPSIPAPNEMPIKYMSTIILICFGIMLGITLSQIIIARNEDENSKRTD